MVVMMMPVLILVFMVVMVMFVLFFLFHHLLHELGLEIHRLLKDLQKLLSGKQRHRRGDDGGGRIQFPDHGDSLVDDLLLRDIRSGEDDGRGKLDLVVEELAEVLHVQPALFRVDHSHRGVVLDLQVRLHVRHSLHDVRKLSDAAGLDDDSVRLVLRKDLLQGAGEISHQGAADASGVHLTDLDPGILQESAVDADLAEFVLDQDHLLAGHGVLQKLTDKCRLSSAEKAGNNVNLCLCHNCLPF